MQPDLSEEWDKTLCLVHSVQSPGARTPNWDSLHEVVLYFHVNTICHMLNLITEEITKYWLKCKSLRQLDRSLGVIKRWRYQTIYYSKYSQASCNFSLKLLIPHNLAQYNYSEALQTFLEAFPSQYHLIIPLIEFLITFDPILQLALLFTIKIFWFRNILSKILSLILHRTK